MMDNMNARKDLKIICNQPELEVDERKPNVMPKSVYTLTKEQKRRICEWISHLNFPGGYAFNLAHCVDMKELRFHGMKTHDYHIFMQKLILIAFLEMLLEPYPSMKRDKVDWMTINKTKARRFIDDSRWTEVAFQNDERIPTPQVVMDNHNFDLQDPKGIQLVIEHYVANQQGASTCRSVNCESDEESDEDSFDED
ncbi:UNVERIFIED_CONTAM: hypothetical protein Sindi_2695000 [Sesamum indicum]